MKKIKVQLLVSVLLLVLCSSLLMGTTYAMAASGTAAEGNTIQTGGMQAGLFWSADLNTWEDASNPTPVFQSDSWEPGRTEVRYFRIENQGDIPFYYTLGFSADQILGDLAQVIDVYCCEAPKEHWTDRSDLLSEAVYAGTLDSLRTTGEKNTYPFLNGSLESGGTGEYAVILRMRESAGNGYQGLSLNGLTLMLHATNQSLN